MKYQNTGEEANFQGVSGYASEGASDLQLGYQTARSRIGDNPISPTEYTRMDSPLYAGLDNGSIPVAHYRNASGRLTEAQAAALERRLRGIPSEQELAQQAANPLQRYPYAPPYDLTRYPAAGINALSGFYPPVTQIGAAAFVSRNHRDHDQVRSPVLEEFKANSKGNKRYELKVNTCLVAHDLSPQD
jgi:mRNA-binding protein PUF3